MQLGTTVPSSTFPLTLAAYAQAWQAVATDAEDAAPVGRIDVDSSLIGTGARAVAYGREDRIAVAPAEAAAFEAALSNPARAGQQALAQLAFTALHEASHVVGPAQPQGAPDGELLAMWEEALASLQARRLLPAALAGAYDVQGVARMPVADVTYGGIVERVVELLALVGSPLDSPSFDADVRTLAESLPWQQRASWLVDRLVAARGAGPLTPSHGAELEQLVLGQVRRTSPGTGRIGALLDASASLS